MDDLADREELLEILTEKARAGSVYACTILLAELRRDGTSSESEEGWAEIYGDGFAAFDAQSNVTSLRSPPS